MVFGLLTAAYVGLRLGAFLPANNLRYPDSGTYLHVAAQPLFSERFLAGWRPWTLPLLYKLLPNYDDWRTAGQLLISIACWLSLAGAVAWHVRSRGMQVLAFGLVLLFSLSVWITQWDRLLLSESLSVSLAAAVLAAWLALVRRPNRWTIAAVLASTVPWAFVRDADAYLVLLAVPFVLGWAALRRPRAGPLVLAAGLVAIFAASVVAQSSSTAIPRREGPALDVIGARVLTNPGELRYFRARGMPLPKPVLALAGKDLGRYLAPGKPLATDRRLDAFRRWVREHGRQTIASYLITHPYRAFKPVVEDTRDLLETVRLGPYRAAGTSPLLPEPVANLVYPGSPAAILIWLAVIAGAAAWLAWHRFARPVWLVPAVTVLFQFPHAALVWNGEPIEIPRHALLVGVLTRLGLLILTIFVIDAGLEWRRQRSSGASAAQLAS